MAKKSSSRRDFSIPGDELEQHRIQLEHNLQNTDLSLHLSSLPDDDAGDHESLEYPRHNSVPEQFPVFPSFDRHSNENLDLDTSHIRAWSIHDDEGIAPYDVRTMSTAAHHASAVTITAGLGRGGRREPSISGAEYDPERPLQDILAACRTGSDTDEADRSQDISRPKLSETLHRVGFSPRRPRGSHSRAQHVVHAIPESTQRSIDVNVARRNATPRARKNTVAFDTSVTPGRRNIPQPAVNVQPPTPSTSGSRFTKMARGLARDVREAQENANQNTAHIPATDLNHESPASKKVHRARVHLPDVTGLTNAVISPAKASLDRHTIRGPPSKEVEARLIASLNALHTRLNHLETENSIARRRVRELEYELEDCRRDVLRERTRAIEAQDISATRIPAPSTSRTKGKKRDVDPNASKYLEVVQEKKALEALITTLRTHLSRVTSDLSAQQQLLEELRVLRESDALSLAEKAQEINQLRTEVERLAGEIEVLRGVVEEGLNERRQGRDSVRRFIDEEEIDRISVDLEERRSERASNSSVQSSHSPSFHREETASLHQRDEEPDEPDDKPNGAIESNPPFPRINSERMERLFFSAPRHNAALCRTCKHHHHDDAGHLHEDEDESSDEQIEPRHQPDHPFETGRGTEKKYTLEEILERMDRNGGSLRPGEIPPQTVLARVVGELEDEFSHFKEIYSGLSEEYMSLDSATQAGKRRVVGDRLRDVIEVLERKGNQIASLYDLLVFKDKPAKC